jgi:hypothetical protein
MKSAHTTVELRVYFTPEDAIKVRRAAKARCSTFSTWARDWLIAHADDVLTAVDSKQAAA